MNTSLKKLLPSLAALVVAAGAWAWRSSAQDTNLTAPSLGSVKEFFVPDYFDPPNQNQMKSLLRGAEALPQPDGKVLIKQLQLESYTPEGKTEMVVRAAECIYDQATQTATSTSHIEARSGDGKLFLEGEGFFWQQNNSIITISNRVHTTIQQPLAKPAA